VDVESRGVKRNFEHREARGSIILEAVSDVKEKQNLLTLSHNCKQDRNELSGRRSPLSVVMHLAHLVS
jgi:hypothetical protein